MICWDQGYGSEGQVQLYRAISALVDLPDVTNPLEDDWWLLEGCVSGLVTAESSFCNNWGDWRLTCSMPCFLVGDMCVYRTCTIQQRHHWSDASRCQLVALVILHMSAPSRRKLGVCTHCKVKPWYANWWRIARCYDLVISCMSRPFRSSCRYQTHSMYIWTGSR